MRNQRFATLAATLVMFVSVYGLAGDVRIIANPSVRADAISAEEIKSIFLQERNSLRDGTHVEPVLSKGGPAHAAFLKDYLRPERRCPAKLLPHAGVHGQGLDAEEPFVPMKKSLATSRGHEARLDT